MKGMDETNGAGPEGSVDPAARKEATVDKTTDSHPDFTTEETLHIIMTAKKTAIEYQNETKPFTLEEISGVVLAKKKDPPSAKSSSTTLATVPSMFPSWQSRKVS